MTDTTNGILNSQEQIGQEVVSDSGDRVHDQMPPDPARDFLGFTRWQAQNMDSTASERTQQEAREQQDRQEAEMENALWQAWHASYEAGKNEMPDLDGALSYLSEMRERQLAALGHIDVRLKNPDARAHQMRDELRDIVAASLQAGENPAKIIYDLAHGFGYGTGGGAAGHAGGMATRFNHLGQAQRGARTLAASSGREAGNPLLLETVANLKEEEFARWYEGNAHAFREMFGG